MICFEKVKRYRNFSVEFRTKNSFSKIDPDTTFIRIKDILDAQLKSGYNLQLVVIGEYIVGGNTSSYRNDNRT